MPLRYLSSVRMWIIQFCSNGACENEWLRRSLGYDAHTNAHIYRIAIETKIVGFFYSQPWRVNLDFHCALFSAFILFLNIESLDFC